LYYIRGHSILTPAQWDLNANWEAKYVWLTLLIDDEKKSLKIEWVDEHRCDS
jgi:hypothetical protein